MAGAEDDITLGAKKGLPQQCDEKVSGFDGLRRTVRGAALVPRNPCRQRGVPEGVEGDGRHAHKARPDQLANSRVDMVLTDHAMPTMTGVELMGIVRKQWPWIPVILASGHADLLDDAPHTGWRNPSTSRNSRGVSRLWAAEQKVVPIEAARRG
jgi:CheY-like chemotaxis protein